MYMKNFLRKTGLFLAALWLVGNVNAQIQCDNNVLSGTSFTAGSPYFAPNWSPSTNYTAAWDKGVFTIHLGDATVAQWQAQMTFEFPAITVVPGQTYFVSFDVTSSTGFKGIATQFKNGAADDADPGKGAGISLDCGTSSLTAGTQTISGTYKAAAGFTSITRLMFDLGNNPANTDITISNLVLCDRYSGVPEKPETYACNGTDILSDISFTAGTIWYSSNGSASTNYTETWNNGVLSLHLGDATPGDWQAQFNLTCASQTLTAGKTYFLSFDIETSVDLPRVYMKLQAAKDNDHFVDLPSLSVSAGKKTVSGITVNTAGAFDEILFDFGGNPAGANITISNITVCDDYISETHGDDQNLIKGGDMESATPWIQVGGVDLDPNDSHNNSQLIWGDVPNDSRTQSYKPQGFNTGGFLTVAENWGVVQYFIAQQVSVTANTTYTLSFDYNYGDYSRAWFEVYMGTTDPTTVTDYTDNRVKESIIPWGEYQPGAGDGHFSKDTTFTKNATFYVVIKMGCGWAGGGGEGYFNISIDNVSLVASTGTNIRNVDLETNNNVVVFGGKSSLSATFEGPAEVSVYSIQGQIIEKVNAQNTFQSGNLPAGIYLVKINNKIFKAIVQ